MSEEARDWWKSQISVSLVFQVVLTVGGWVAVVTTVKNNIADHERRISVIESEIVPRKEHEAAAKIEEQKEKLLDERLSNIERTQTQLLEAIGRITR